MKKVKILLCSVLIMCGVMSQFNLINAKVYTGKVVLKVSDVEKKKHKVKMTLTVDNNTDKSVEVESCYVLQKKDDDKWKTVKYKKNVASTSSLYTIEPDDEMTVQINLSSMYPKKKLTEGTFRLGVVINDTIKSVKFAFQ